MNVHILNPLTDRRWDSLVARHPNASVFHQRGWLESLALTYGYEPFVMTTAPAGEPLENGIAMCRIQSWLTGSRIVSLPFSDHCQPLFRDSKEIDEFFRLAQEACDDRPCRYAEFRPISSPWDQNGQLQASSSYWFHEMNLGAGLPEIFRGLHKNSFQRKIRRAEREGIKCEVGRSDRLLDEFYALLLLTRKRHQLIPQPKAWFRNLLKCLGGSVEIRVARKDKLPLASILTLRHGSTVVYKYGCSDQKFHNLGAMPFLIWSLIEQSIASGVQKIDFGRTAKDNLGLTVFKDRLGADKRSLTYYRYVKTARRGVAALFDSPILRHFLGVLPEHLSEATGKLLYRHLG